MKLRTLCSAAALAVGFAGSAVAYPQFTVDETAYSGSSAINANLIGFGYKTEITTSGVNAFNETGGIKFSALETNAANPVFGSTLNSQYVVVGNLVGAGTYSTYIGPGGAPALSGNFSSLTLTLYLVPGSQVLGLSQSGNGTWTGAGIDSTNLLTIASLNTATTSDATLVTCSTGDTACGSWSINTVLDTPNSLFSSYFTSPDPFYFDMGSLGENNPPISLTSPIIDTGNGNAFFQVPEPASLTLFGGGLLWAGMAARRRRRKQQA
jgi:hypothetical protein